MRMIPWDSPPVTAGGLIDIATENAGDIDVVTCGSGKDTVFASAGDVINVDCEDVRR